MCDANDIFNLLAFLLIDVNKYGSEVFKNFIDEKYEEIITCKDGELENIFYNIISINTNDNFFELKENWLLYARFIFLADRFSGQESILKSIQNGIASLNNKYMDDIEIYPAYNTSYRFRHSSSNFYYFFKNLMIFFKSTIILKDMKINNYYISEKQEEISIGYIPYPKTILPFEYSINNKCFSKERSFLNDNDYFYLEQCKQLIKTKNIDILFGPEMDGSLPLDREIRKLMYRSSIEDKTPLAILCPSYHNINNGIKINSSTLYIKHNNNVSKQKVLKNTKAIMNDKKQNKHSLIEDIDDSQKMLNIIHIKGFGKICFLICKDFIEDYIIDLIKVLNIDIIIVQCYTNSIDSFKDKIIELNSNNHITIIGNSCSTEIIEVDKLIYGDNNKTLKSYNCTKECNYEHCKLINVIKIKLDDKRKKYITHNAQTKGVNKHEKLQNK